MLKTRQIPEGKIKVALASPELSVRNPADNYRRLTLDGAWVDPDAYWLTHMRDGAVIQIDGPPIDAPATE